METCFYATSIRCNCNKALFFLIQNICVGQKLSHCGLLLNTLLKLRFLTVQCNSSCELFYYSEWTWLYFAHNKFYTGIFFLE